VEEEGLETNAGEEDEHPISQGVILLSVGLPPESSL
jgi:hypothetical protein